MHLHMSDIFCNFAAENERKGSYMTAIVYKTNEEKRAARQRMLEMKAAWEAQMKIKLASLSL